MKRLLALAAIAFTAWYGWNHYPSIIEKRPSHMAVIENRSGVELRRIRLKVGGRTFVKETLADRARAEFRFRIGDDASFDMEWNWSDRPNETTWRGGRVAKGPMVQRYLMTVTEDGGVTYRAENLPAR
jgi:hypothetical protein